MEGKTPLRKSRLKNVLQCPISGDVLTNKIQCIVVKPTGHVITSKSMDVVKKG